MKIPFDNIQLQKRIALNYDRLAGDPYYQIDQVFAPTDYDWYGDKEGRALLAFVSHYKISGQKILCMEQLLEQYTCRANDQLYFGPKAGEVIHEQQLSGHSWLLRGLCEYHAQFGDAFSLQAVRSIVQHLYLPLKGRIYTYPIDRSHADEGGVSGNSLDEINGWKLSSDIGCAFMSIDGLSHAYQLLRNPELLELLDEMIFFYASIDKVALRAQTHCTLTAARGMMRLYELTGKESYLHYARDIYELYVYGGGMTYTYQNLNWWGRPDSWTEPCAIVDSLMLALMLYKATGVEEYRRTAVRIYINGLASAQRSNGGAGTDSLLCPGSGHHSLFMQMYEAYFCCTMRLAEGLWYISENTALLWSEKSETIEINEHGIYRCGDYLYAEISGGGESYREEAVEVDGHTLSPLLKYYKLPDDIAANTKQKLVFKEDSCASISIHT